MYVCTYVCMYVCMYVCNVMYVCMYACMYACMYVCVYVCIVAFVYRCLLLDCFIMILYVCTFKRVLCCALRSSARVEHGVRMSFLPQTEFERDIPERHTERFSHVDVALSLQRDIPRDSHKWKLFWCSREAHREIITRGCCLLLQRDISRRESALSASFFVLL